MISIDDAGVRICHADCTLTFKTIAEARDYLDASYGSQVMPALAASPRQAIEPVVAEPLDRHTTQAESPYGPPPVETSSAGFSRR